MYRGGLTKYYEGYTVLGKGRLSSLFSYYMEVHGKNLILYRLKKTATRQCGLAKKSPLSPLGMVIASPDWNPAIDVHS